MFCQKCGAQIIEGASFCQKCGAKAVLEDAEAQVINTPETTEEDAKVENGTVAEKELSKLEKWWSNLSKGKMILLAATALLIVILVLVFLIKHLWAVAATLAVVIVAVGVIRSVLILIKGKGSKKEKKGAWKEVVIGLVLLVVVIAFNQNTKSGAEVREAYLTQYSQSVTVGRAFDNFFDKGEWSTYKSDDYKYVVFKGVCEYLGERADARVTFKVTGENFVVDKLEINGIEQNDLMLAILLEEIYADY